MSLSAEKFREQADECHRLSVRLKDPDHKSFALFLASAWLELAKQAERKPGPPDGTVPTIGSLPADSQAKDRIE
jgi:hypothetical protein